MGWHSNPYIGREFHGLWGNFDVTISIDKKYVVGGSGVLQNADEIGYGYTNEKGMSKKVTGDKIDWHFIAENVHDFMWAADPDYTHTTFKTEEGTLLHFFYQENERTKENWENLPRVMAKALTYMNKKFGKYPYPVYSFIQGGDGGMEYPMATLITGERNFGSLVGVSIHEWFHSWYQMVLGSNESLYAWMDEGFTSFGSAETMNYLRKEKLIPGNISENPHKSTVAGFVSWKARGLEEALSTHSDHFNTNNAYGQAAYTKGAIFMSQLKSIVGEKAFDSALLRYFNTWKFRHPNENDVIREFEKESGLELDWYKEYWVYSTHDIDYGIDSVYSENNKTIIALQKFGRMPMPQDVTVVLNDDTKLVYNIPLVIMRGDKSKNTDIKIIVAPDWPWVNRNYHLNLDIPISDIKAVYLDEAYGIADVDRSNNSWFSK
jgi:aminopeptidase N